MIDKTGVCESYSESFALVARFCGLNAIVETGTLEGGPHEWNRVNVDGDWYIVDVTNNDIDEFSNTLLMESENQVQGTLIPDGSAYLDNFSASDDTNDYYYKNEKYAKSDDELTQLIKDASNDGKEITNIKVDYSLGYTEDQLYSKIGELVKSGEADIRSAGYFNNTLALLK